MRYAFCAIAKRPVLKLYLINPLSKAHGKYRKKMEFCSQKRSINIHTPPPPPPARRRRASEIPKGGGVQKKAISEDVGGCLERFLSRGSEWDWWVILVHNSFSVERATSYFTVTGVSKQVSFPLIIYYLTRLDVIFTAYIVFFYTTVIGSWINFRLSCSCFITHLFPRSLVGF